MKKPLVLITNDDGVLAPGIRAIADALRDFADVVIAAPDRERSAASHSISLDRPLRVDEIEPSTYAIDGTPVDCVYLALLHRAVFAFEDFLLSRYHMFLSVYFHSTSVGYEVLLQRWCESGEYALPADPDEYLLHDDVTLLGALRSSQNPWARRIVRRQGYRVLMENAAGEDARTLHAMQQRLEEAGVNGFVTVSRGVLSHYGKEATLWVKSPRGEVPIGDYTPLYERYAEAATLARLYVEPERWDEARRLLTVQ